MWFAFHNDTMTVLSYNVCVWMTSSGQDPIALCTYMQTSAWLCLLSSELLCNSYCLAAWKNCVYARASRTLERCCKAGIDKQRMVEWSASRKLTFNAKIIIWAVSHLRMTAMRLASWVQYEEMTVENRNMSSENGIQCIWQGKFDTVTCVGTSAPSCYIRATAYM